MTDETLRQLEPPPDAREKGGHEVLRCFVVDGTRCIMPAFGAYGGLSVGLRRSFDEPGTWGILLADLARHAARIYALETQVSEDDALQAIKDMFDAEWSRPTDFGTTSAMN
jgi:metallophosphoesterase superfamily enzyme